MASPKISSDPAKALARLVSTPWPEPLRRALARVSEGGHRALLVGGTVRDALLDLPPRGAYDVATDLLPDAVSARFERVEPIGLAHGTVLVIVDDLRIECTTFRREGPYRDARPTQTAAEPRHLPPAGHREKQGDHAVAERTRRRARLSRSLSCPSA